MSRFVLNGQRAAVWTRRLWPSGTSPRTRSSSRAPASGGSCSRSGRWSSRWPSLSFDNLTLITNLVQTYPSSVQNLNRLTMTVDVDIYDEESQKVEIPAMPGDSPIKVIVSLLLSLTVGRLRQWEWRERTTTGFWGCQNPTRSEWPRDSNLSRWCGSSIFLSCSYSGLPQRRRMQPIIYHKVVVNRTYSTINLQIKGFNPYK